MSQDRSDDGTPAPRDTDIRFDDWPVRGYDEGDEPRTQYLATAEASTSDDSSTVIVYDEDADEIVETRVDEDDERLVPREDATREFGDAETIGEALEALGDRLHVDSLSAFAREHLQDDEDDVDDAGTGRDNTAAGQDDTDGAERVEPETITFTRSNVSPADDHHLEFSGSHTYRTEEGRAYMVERTFEVTLVNPDDPTSADIEVTERLMRAEAPDETERRGDADPLETAATSISVDLDYSSERAVEDVVETRCREWHASNREPLA